MSEPDEHRERSFRRRTLRLAPDDWHAVLEPEWAGALVLLRGGEIEVHGLGGECRRFRAGAVLCFDGLGLRALHNPGRSPAMIVGIFRRSVSPAPPGPARRR